MDIQNQANLFTPILVALAPILLKVPNEVIHDENGFGLKLGGFYKDGNVTIRAKDDGELTYVVSGRYDDNLLEIYPGEDVCDALVRLNADRFRYWNSVKPEFNTIDPNWLPLLKEAGLIKEQISYSLA